MYGPPPVTAPEIEAGVDEITKGLLAGFGTSEKIGLAGMFTTLTGSILLKGAGVGFLAGK